MTPTAAAAKKNPATEPKDVRTFYIRKGQLSMLLNGIQTFQKREDISGKFARKLTQQARVGREHLEALLDEEKALQELHKEKFPEGHPNAGEVKPVYEETSDQKPVYEKDGAGNDTDKRKVIPGQFRFTDPVKYNEDRQEMLKEYVAIEIPCFRITSDDARDDKFVAELDRFQKVNGAAYDACAMIEEGSPNEKLPEGKKVFRLITEADDRPGSASGPKLVTDERDEKQLAPVDAAADEGGGSEDERTAP